MADIAAGAGAAASLGYGIYAGEKANKAQKQALKSQERTQAEARAMAERQQRSSEEAINRANRKAPDVNAILKAAQEAGTKGMSTSMLTGSRGVDPATLNLSRSTLLGE